MCRNNLYNKSKYSNMCKKSLQLKITRVSIEILQLKISFSLIEKMSLNTLPPEVLERIFELTDDNWYRPCDINSRMRYLKQFALVCRKWDRIAMPIIWKEVIISSYGRESINKTFSFYRHIINLYINCEQNIRMLELRHVIFWPVCIAKILQTYSDIQDLRITEYYPKEDKVKID